MRRFLLLAMLIFSGCQQMGATEYGVVFRNLPSFFGGGTLKTVRKPGTLVPIMPWERIIKIDTATRIVSWDQNNYIRMRASDGNEVALAMTVRYQIKPDQAGLLLMIKNGATSNEEIESLVREVASSDIRLYMNELNSSQYLEPDTRYKALDRVRETLREELAPYNIETVAVNLEDFRFERRLPDGSIDASYQEKLNESRQYSAETTSEEQRTGAVVAKKQQEYDEAQATISLQITEAKGYKDQAVLKGDAYYEVKKNEAKAILATGRAKAEGLSDEVEALSGPGGSAILKLEVIKDLIKSKPKFIVVDSLPQMSVAILRTDLNEMMQQTGIFDGLSTNSQLSARQVPESTEK